MAGFFNEDPDRTSVPTTQLTVLFERIALFWILMVGTFLALVSAQGGEWIVKILCCLTACGVILVSSLIAPVLAQDDTEQIEVTMEF